MEDKKIVDLYWERSETAILETSKKYGKLCYSIAYKILRNNEDSEECVNDTYLGAWNAMPSKRPETLTPFLAKMTRNLSINKYVYNTAKKRGGGQVSLSVDELDEMMSSDSKTDSVTDEEYFADLINGFLDGLSERNRDIFIARYWENSTVSEIAELYGMNEGTVNVALHRIREKLKEILIREEIFI